MFYKPKKQETRTHRRNGEIGDETLPEVSLCSKNTLSQIKENLVQKDLERIKSNDRVMKQRNKKEENYTQVFPNFIFGKHQYDPELIKKHLKLLYQGLLYSSLALGKPSQSFLKNKFLTLPQPQVKKQKILMLDLDETLIHTVGDHEDAEVQLPCGSGLIRFNVRPFCQVFLQAVSQSYQVYVFTSAVESYAKIVIDYLNTKSKYILGFLHRSHCMETKRGLRIKDLRIIKNRELSKIVMVDNLLHSFGLQLQNGIPILQFTNQKEDKELLGLTKILRQIEQVEDVREYLRDRFQLKKCVNYPQALFLQLNYQNLSYLKQRKTIG